ARSRAFMEIAAARAGNGDTKGALAALDAVDDKFQRAEGLGRIAAARASEAPADARNMFTQALTLVSGARGPASRKCDSLVEIARAQVISGDREGSTATLRQVFALLPDVRREPDRIQFLARIAPLQARAGDYAGAFATAMRAEDSSLRPLLV